MSLLDLRKQITSTTSTRSITKAMQLVAANKMKSFVREAHAARVYLAELEKGHRAVSRLSPHIPSSSKKQTKTLFFLFTSDKGLCGSLNLRVIKTLLHADAWTTTPSSERLVVAFGQKGHEHLRRLNIPLAKKILRAPERLDTPLAWKLFGTMLDQILDRHVEKAFAVYPVYETAFSFKTVVSPFLFSDARDQTSVEGGPREGIAGRAVIEPSVEGYLKQIESRMITSKIITCVAELKATEYSSRMVAMQKATDAAAERIAVLTNAYHKARQSLITQELAELSAAGEAMNSTYENEISLLSA